MDDTILCWKKPAQLPCKHLSCKWYIRLDIGSLVLTIQYFAYTATRRHIVYRA